MMFGNLARSTVSPVAQFALARAGYLDALCSNEYLHPELFLALLAGKFGKLSAAQVALLAAIVGGRSDAEFAALAAKLPKSARATAAWEVWGDERRLGVILSKAGQLPAGLDHLLSHLPETVVIDGELLARAPLMTISLAVARPEMVTDEALAQAVSTAPTSALARAQLSRLLVLRPSLAEFLTEPGHFASVLAGSPALAHSPASSALVSSPDFWKGMSGEKRKYAFIALASNPVFEQPRYEALVKALPFLEYDLFWNRAATQDSVSFPALAGLDAPVVAAKMLRRAIPRTDEGRFRWNYLPELLSCPGLAVEELSYAAKRFEEILSDEHSGYELSYLSGIARNTMAEAFDVLRARGFSIPKYARDPDLVGRALCSSSCPVPFPPQRPSTWQPRSCPGCSLPSDRPVMDALCYDSLHGHVLYGSWVTPAAWDLGISMVSADQYMPIEQVFCIPEIVQ